MKHVPEFNKFLNDHVNLDQCRLDKLESRVKYITKLIEARLDDYENYSPQGSYAHGTIIKPVKDDDEFDADILIFLRDRAFFPHRFSRDYVKELHTLLANDSSYRDKLRLKTRCVTIKYTGDFHIDLVPCVRLAGRAYICNRDEKRYEPTDGNAYKDWLAKMNRTVGGNHLKKSIRLLKYLRDHKDNFCIPSILLTTIAGNQVYPSIPGIFDYDDLPTTLRTLSNQIDSNLKNHPNIPDLMIPRLPLASFGRIEAEWNYQNFREKFHIYTKKINEAFDERDRVKSVRLWRALFGDEFGI